MESIINSIVVEVEWFNELNTKLRKKKEKGKDILERRIVERKRRNEKREKEEEIRKRM